MNKTEALSYQLYLELPYDPTGESYRLDQPQTDGSENLEVRDQAVEFAMMEKLLEQTADENVNWKNILASLDNENRTNQPSLFSPDILTATLNLSTFNKVQFSESFGYQGKKHNYSRYGNMNTIPAGKQILNMSLQPFSEDVILLHTIVGLPETKEKNTTFRNIEFTYIRSKSTNQPLYVSLKERRSQKPAASIEDEPTFNFTFIFHPEENPKNTFLEMSISGTQRPTPFHGSFYNTRKRLS